MGAGSPLFPAVSKRSSANSSDDNGDDTTHAPHQDDSKDFRPTLAV
jgi:hypothetical protein